MGTGETAGASAAGRAPGPDAVGAAAGIGAGPAAGGCGRSGGGAGAGSGSGSGQGRRREAVLCRGTGVRATRGGAGQVHQGRASGAASAALVDRIAADAAPDRHPCPAGPAVPDGAAPPARSGPRNRLAGLPQRAAAGRLAPVRVQRLNCPPRPGRRNRPERAVPRAPMITAIRQNPRTRRRRPRRMSRADGRARPGCCGDSRQPRRPGATRRDQPRAQTARMTTHARRPATGRTTRRIPLWIRVGPRRQRPRVALARRARPARAGGGAG